MKIGKVIIFLCLILFASQVSETKGNTGSTKNLIKNSSFEVGLEGYSFVGGVYVSADKKDNIFIAPVLDTSEKYNGLVSLKIDNSKRDAIKIFVKEVKLEAGKKYTFSFWGKTSASSSDVKVELRGRDDKTHSTDLKSGSFKLTTQWQRYFFSHTIPKSQSYYYTEFNINTVSAVMYSGIIWIDALQIEEGEVSEYKSSDVEIGTESSLGRRYTLSLEEKIPIKFKIRNNTSNTTKLKIKYNVIDEYFQKELDKKELSIAVEGSSTLEKAIDNISPKKRGKFILNADLIDEKTGAVLDKSSFDFAVIESVKKKELTDGFTICGTSGLRANFGWDYQNRQVMQLWGGNNLNDIFDFRAQAGDRWIRDIGEDVFFWRAIQPEENKFDWTLTDIYVEEAVKHGIKIMPVLGRQWVDIPSKWYLGTFPDWFKKKAKFEPVADERNAQKGHKICLTGLDDWFKFVSACVERYKGKITHWEIVNEPNWVFTPEQYVEYLKSMYKTIKKADSNAKVVGFCSTGDMSLNLIKFLEDCFKLGALEYCDVVSFHPYNARLDSSLVSAETMISRIKELMKQYNGEKKELWNTELFYMSDKNAEDEHFQRNIKGHELARRFLIDFASGVSKSFCVIDNYFTKMIIAPNFWAVERTLTDLIPDTHFVIYNTITKLFAEGKFVERIQLEGKNKLYIFEKNNVPISAAWNYEDKDNSGIIKFPEAVSKLKFLDIMGNEIAENEINKKGKDIEIEVTNSPIYIQPNNIKKEEFVKIIKSATGKSKKPLILFAQSSFIGDKPAIALEIRNITSKTLNVQGGVRALGDEFEVKPNTKGNKVQIAKESSGTVYIPIDENAKWEKANIMLQAQLENEIITSETEVKAKNLENLAECKVLKNNVQINGKIEADEWNDAGIIEINKKEQIKYGRVEEWSGINDCSAKCFMKYDAEALYLGFKVLDEMRGERNIETHLWDGDAIEIFIDLQPDKNMDRADYTEDGYQIIFGMPTKKFSEIAYFDVRNGISLKDIKNDPNYKMEGVRAKTVLDKGGYDLEIKIPWKYFGVFMPVIGNTIGFDIAIDDGDEKEGRAYQIIWAGEKNNSANRTNLGRLLFR